MQLITITHAYITTVFRLGSCEREMQDVQDLIAEINSQQSEKLEERGDV
jgi:hypothetical protein